MRLPAVRAVLEIIHDPHPGRDRVVEPDASRLGRQPAAHRGGASARRVPRGCRLLVLPELCTTGYGCEDAFLGPDVAKRAWSMLMELVPQTKGMVVSVGHAGAAPRRPLQHRVRGREWSHRRLRRERAPRWRGAFTTNRAGSSPGRTTRWCSWSVMGRATPSATCSSISRVCASASRSARMPGSRSGAARSTGTRWTSS